MVRPPLCSEGSGLCKLLMRAARSCLSGNPERCHRMVSHVSQNGGTVENTLVRSKPCPVCGAAVLWTQNAWKSGDTGFAAYRCLTGHVIDPTQTRQCPNCGVHDT